MKIAKALKEKNKLVKDINSLYTKIANSMNVIVGKTHSYDVNMLLQELETKINELSELKTKIHLANAPVYSKIFLLGELKNKVSKLKSITLYNGPSESRWGQTSSIEYSSQLSQVELDNLVKHLEEKISTIQDELDEFNALTSI